MEYKFIEKLSPQQSGLVVNFMDSLEENDIDLFLSTLSKEDKSYLKGSYEAIGATGEDEFTYDEWKAELFRRVKEIFHDYISNYGVSTSVRHHNKISANIYLQKGVKVPITYIAETEVQVMKLPIILELHLNENDELSGEWRINYYSNNEL
ncbi:hypothetical protein SFC50_25730 [Bacillus infantis]|uniref:hypothetical protein n=1 Tax=Bacillus infantis TaxID=324767 RepID=UPI003982AB54